MSEQQRERVALAITPSPFLADERVFPSLGPLKVAAVLERAGHDVDMLDLSGVEEYEKAVRTYVENTEAQVLGITATTPQFPQAVRIAETARKFNPRMKIVFGGAHATMVGSAFKLDERKKTYNRGSRAYDQMRSIFDVSIIGDGEEAIFAAINPDSPEVIDAGDMKSPYFLQKGTLESYPFPARHLIDMASYHYQIDGQEAQSLIAQLGCPFECGFCGGRNTQSFRVARSRGRDSVMAEVDELVKKYGRSGIMFYDDELNISDKTFVPLLEDLIGYQEKSGVNLRLRGFVKAELFTQEQADLMHRAGFRVILSGVESGDRGMLDTMQKHTTPEINSDWVKKCHDAGLRAKALMSIGHPGETEQTIQNSIDWVLANLKPGDDVDFTIITQYPGSPYFDNSVPHATEEGVWVYTAPKTGNVLYSQDVNFGEKAEYYKGVPGDYTSYVWTDRLSPKQLVAARDQAESQARQFLKLPMIQAVPAIQFDHSMGQRSLPPSILRSTRP